MNGNVYQVTFSAQVVVNFNPVEDTALTALVVDTDKTLHVNVMQEGVIPIALQGAYAANVIKQAESIVRNLDKDDIHLYHV